MIYKKIATELRTRINSDDYAVGDMLPSEKALAAELKVSVMTLRKALALLEEEKLIARRHGSGTCIVRKSNYHGGELEGFNYQMQVVGVTNYRNKVIEFTLLDAPPAIAQQLKIQPGEKVYYVRRLRLIDEVPILVENSYIPFATFPWLSVGNLEQSSEMVAHGAGGAILPRVIAERYRQRYSFAVIGLQDRWAQRRLCLCYQDDASLSPAMRRLLEWLRQP